MSTFKMAVEEKAGWGVAYLHWRWPEQGTEEQRSTPASQRAKPSKGGEGSQLDSTDKSKKKQTHLNLLPARQLVSKRQQPPLLCLEHVWVPLGPIALECQPVGEDGFVLGASGRWGLLGCGWRGGGGLASGLLLR